MSRSPEVPVSPEYLDPAEAAEWFPYSFYFSQGDGALQRKIFQYLKLRRPNQKFGPETISEIKRLSAKEIASLVLRPEHPKIKKRADIGDQMTKELDSWQKTFDTPITEIPTKEDLMDEILQSIMLRDYEFLTGGTEGLETKGRASGPLGDIWLSHFVHYVIFAGDFTYGDSRFEFRNLPKIFQEMFLDLRQRFKDLMALARERAQLNKRQRYILSFISGVIIRNHNYRHPKNQVNEEEWILPEEIRDALHDNN